jgi:hypothetical protein
VLRALHAGPRAGWALRRAVRRKGSTFRTDARFVALMQGLVDRGLVAAWTPGPGAMVWYRITAAGAGKEAG